MRALILAATFFSGLAIPGESEAAPYEVADSFTGMREQVFKLDGKAIPGLQGKAVWAVLMETGRDDEAITVVSVADGSASLYFSKGGGMIGLGENPEVRAASLAFVKKSAAFLKFMKRVEVYPLPKSGQTYFYLVTSKGVYSYRADRDDLGRQQDKLSTLYYAGHELIAQVRTADQKRKGE